MQAIKLFHEGQELHQKGKRQEALQRYERAIKIDPSLSGPRIFKAVIYLELGKPLEALKEAELALDKMKKPDIVVLVNYGIILKNLGRFDDAALAYERALEINPRLNSAKSNLATIYLLQGKLDKAEKAFTELSQVMEEPAPWLNLARIAILKNETEKAIEYVSKAEDFDLTHPDCSFIRGRIALADKDFAEAYKQCIKSLKRAPAHRDSWLLLQTIDSEVFDLLEISDRLQELAKLQVQSSAVLSIAVDICRKHWLWQSLPKLESMLSNVMLNNLDKAPSTSDIFTLLGANITQEAHKNAATKCWEVLTSGVPRHQVPSFQRDIENKKIRVGIISSDLRGHAIGYLVVGLFENLPKENIEWWAYTSSLTDSSDVRERLKDNFDRFINISKLDDHELADKIRSDQIDVLIDLNQMTAGTRVAVFAHRPAPIQIQWLGMPGTLGAGEDADYVIVDPWVVNEKNANGFSECLLMLPRSYQPNDHIPPNRKLCASREEAGLPETGFIFGVFNQYYKYSPETVSLWASILKEVPDSYLWLLKPKTEQHQKRVTQEFEDRGVAAERIIFADQKPQDEHLARLQFMDLVLDTWPYNAHTTCSDALRLGVPVLTYPHDTFASRVASGILHTANLSRWVAYSPEEYVQKAIEFAKQSRSEVDAYKEEVQRIYWQSPMVDNQQLGKMFEAMILGLQERQLANQKPTSLTLKEDLQIEQLPFGRQDGGPQSAINTKSSVNQEKVKEVSSNRLVESEPAKEVQEEGNRPEWANTLQRSGPKSQVQNLKVLKDELLSIHGLPIFLDVGAAFEGKPKKFDQLCAANLIQVIGFEPDPQSFAKLKDSTNARYLPFALGNGQEGKLNICTASGMNSLLKPNQKWLSLFPKFAEWGSIKKTMEIKTHRLDDILEARQSRYIKLDVQGAEKMILENGLTVLKNVCFLEFESSPTPLYENEPSFFEIGSWLEQQGFVLHTLTDINKRCFKPYGTDEEPFSAKEQIFQVDAIFMPHPLQWGSFDDERLKCIAYIAHIMYRSFDVALRALSILDERDGGQRVEQYRIYLDTAGLSA